MASITYPFICKKCNTQYSKENFETLLQEATPYLPCANVYLVKVSCSNCGHKTEFSRKGTDGILYQGDMWFPEGEKPEKLDWYFDNRFIYCPAEQEALNQAYADGQFQEPYFSENIQEAPRRVPPPPPKTSVEQLTQNNQALRVTKLFNFTDAGNAKRLAHRHGENVRYIVDWGWLVWNGKIWELDNENIKITRMAKDTAEKIFDESVLITDEAKRKNLKKHALKSEDAPRIKSMIGLAKSEKELSANKEDFDNQDWFLNLENGTIDLKNFQRGLFPHSRENYFTKIMPVVYDPLATCPDWHKYINRVMNGNENLVRFLQRAVGYALTGNVDEQCLFILHGTGANGKSTFIETIRGLMGSFALNTDFDTFSDNQKNIRNDLARLTGTRFVSAVEASSTTKFDERTVKMMTGKDQITVRFLYKEYFDYHPKFKLFLAVNHLPHIEGAENAIWRRIIPIPFKVKIPDAEQNKNFIEILRNEYSGILNWAIEGYFDWQKLGGLHPPDEINKEKNKYKCEVGTIENFLEDSCVFEPGQIIAKKQLYENYLNWCLNNYEAVLTKKTFGKKLIEKDVEDGKSGGIRYWKGIRLKEMVPLPPPPNNDAII